MTFKKHGRVIFGVELNAAEQRAVNEAIDEQLKAALATAEKQHRLDLDTLVMYVLYKHFGFNKAKLKDFYDAVQVEHDNLLKHYELGADDFQWLARKALASEGVDVEAWYKEVYGDD